MILKSYLKDKHQKQESQNITLTIEDIIDECKVFYLAGQETTTVLLVWAMVLLSKHQKWQALAREEVLAVFGDNKPVFDGLNQLKTVSIHSLIYYGNEHNLANKIFYLPLTGSVYKFSFFIQKKKKNTT